MLRLCELFYSIEGEGLWSGRAATVVRLSGCNLKCKFCDTKFSSWWDNDTQEMTVEQIFDFIKSKPTKFVSITGGEPLFRPEAELNELFELMRLLVSEGYVLKIETNATIWDPRLPEVPTNVFCSLSPKLLGMGDHTHLNYKVIREYVEYNRSTQCPECGEQKNIQLKFVVGSRLCNSTMEADLAEIKKLIESIPEIIDDQIPVILQPEGLTENVQEYCLRLAILAERMSFENNTDSDFWKQVNYRVLPQVHRLCWNNRRQV